MSAYMCDRHHIAYLVRAAEDYRSLDLRRDGEWIKLTPNEAGQMLWDENIRSVSSRYPDCDPHDLPGEINAAPYLFKISPHDCWPHPHAAQVLKAIQCYQYQSSEHPEWEASEAAQFVATLREAAIRHLPKYNDLEWGAPLPGGNIVRIM
jgi:hypothetical protein